MNKLITYFKSPGLTFSFQYFLASRIVILIIAYCATHEFALHNITKPSEYKFSDNIFFSFLGTYDTGWYLRIVENWYPNLHSKPIGYTYEEYSFFPLYPFLIKLFSTITTFKYFYSGLIISNISIVIAGNYLYKIVLKTHRKIVAKQAVILMYVFPVSFIFSGVFTEALYLLLILISINAALNKCWWQAGVFAMLLTTCRPIGLFVFVPLLLIYAKQINWKWQLVKFDMLWLFLVFLGVLILAIHHYIFGGNEFSFTALYGAGYKLPLSNPLQTTYHWITENYFSMSFLAWFTTVFIFIWMLFYKHLNLALHSIVAYSLFIPMCYTLMSMPRMMLVAFPLFILLASVAHKFKFFNFLVLIFAMLQGYLLVCWCLGFGNVI